MPDTQQRPQSAIPAIPDGPQQEGARWRFHRPDSSAVAQWFNTVPLDEDMTHADYVGGVVLISQREKTQYQTDRGTAERMELVFTPYMQIGTRVGYARRLAEKRELYMHNVPAEVPRSVNPASPYFNANMPEGLWWHVVVGDGEHGQQVNVRYLCATHHFQLFERQEYAKRLRGESALAVIEAYGTKQVGGGADANALMKAQTGAMGRALGVAGILVVGTGIATAEDMTEFVASPAASPDEAQLPPSEIAPGELPKEPDNPEEALAQLRSATLAVQVKLQEDLPEKWAEFATWWQERAKNEGWGELSDVPLDALRGVYSYMQRLYAEGQANAQTEVPA